MNYSSDLIDSEISSNQSFIAPPDYPSVFGLTFTPLVMGVGLAVVGMGAAGYLFMNYVQPQLIKNQELETKLAQTQEQIQLRKDNAKKIVAAEQERERVKAQRQLVVSLFASDKKLDTLLLDLNKLVNILQGKLQKFMPETPAAGGIPGGATVVTDGSMGAPLNYKVKRKGVAIEVTGSFEQVQSILRTIERLDQLLVIKDFRADVDKSSQKIVVDAQGRIVPQPDSTLKASFKMNALIPLTPEEQLAAAPPPPPPTKKK